MKYHAGEIGKAKRMRSGAAYNYVFLFDIPRSEDVVYNMYKEYGPVEVWPYGAYVVY